MWAIQDGNRTWSIPSTETSDSILPNSESRISLTSLYHHSDGRTLWNLFGLCFNNCPDSWIIEQSSKTRILILNPRDDNSYTTLNRLSTHSTFPQLFGTWVTCYQMSTRSKGSAHLFMEAYLTSHFFSMQVDFMLYICNDFLLLVRWYITPKQKHVDRKEVLLTTLNWVGHFQDVKCSGASIHRVSLHLPMSHGKLKPAC